MTHGTCVACSAEGQVVARGLCGTCYGKHHHLETLDQFPKLSRAKKLSRDDYPLDWTKTCRKCSFTGSSENFYWKSDQECYGNECKKCHGTRIKTLYKQDPSIARNQGLKARYKLTPEEFGKILADQGGGCAICKSLISGNGRSLSVDHDHRCCPGKKSCGKCIRGILCSYCNNGLGQFRDDPRRLMRAAEYLGGAIS